MQMQYEYGEGVNMLAIRNGLDKRKTYDVEEGVWPVKLDANEMPEGYTGQLSAIVAGILTQVPLNRYPQIAARDLRQTLACELKLDIEEILVGNGSSELLRAICYAFGGAGRRILFPTPSFSMYGVYTNLADSEPVPFPLSDGFALSPEKLIASAKAAKVSLIILCNPNNPTGTIMPQADIEYIAANAECPVVVDEAYYEFYGQSSQNLLAKYPNLIITRTFSKAYGLAAARVGYLMTNRTLAGIIGKVLLPYQINALSLAVASAVFSRREEVMPAIREIIAERSRLASLLAGVGDISVFPSEANFLLIKTVKSLELAKQLDIQGIGVRDFSKNPGLDNCIRITVGTRQENEEVAEAISSFFTRG